MFKKSFSATFLPKSIEEQEALNALNSTHFTTLEDNLVEMLGGPIDGYIIDSDYSEEINTNIEFTNKKDEIIIKDEITIENINKKEPFYYNDEKNISLEEALKNYKFEGKRNNELIFTFNTPIFNPFAEKKYKTRKEKKDYKIDNRIENLISKFQSVSITEENYEINNNVDSEENTGKCKKEKKTCKFIDNSNIKGGNGPRILGSKRR